MELPKKTSQRNCHLHIIWRMYCMNCPFVFSRTSWLNITCVACIKRAVMSLAETFSSRPVYKKEQISRRWQMSRGSVCCRARQLDNPLEWAQNFGGWRICSIKVQRPPTRSAMTIELKSGHFLQAYAPLKPWSHPSATYVQICLFCGSQNTFRR